MLVIFVAHVPGNAWTLWIPARFGFSDATEVFVFCSGLASALAFGGVFARAGWLMGTLRILHRVWQVYWAQIGMVLATLAALALATAGGWGLPGKDYVLELPYGPLLETPVAAILGLMTLGWVPNYFDILPMYLVILALVPLVMALYGLAGRGAVIAGVAGLWLAVQLGLPGLDAIPGEEARPWFFNPFAWQLVFFTGFGFGMGWLPAPPVRRDLVLLAAAVLLLSLPVAWPRLRDGFWLPHGSVQEALYAAHAALLPLVGKTGFGALRYLHFLAFAYLAWVASGPGGERLRTGFRGPGAAPAAWRWLAVVAAMLTIPYAWTDEIRWLSPALDAVIIGALGPLGLLAPADQIGIPQLVHLIALGLLGWSALGQARRDWLTGPGFAGIVPVIRTVGSQSLAVFMTSMVLAQLAGVALDALGRSMWSGLLVNLGGFGLLVATAYGVGWIKGQPWRQARPGREAAPAALAAAE